MNKLYKVYIHTVPNGDVYVGVTCQKYLNKRWNQSAYKGTSLYPYIEKLGWDNIIHQVIYTTPDRKEAYKVEEEMRKYYEEKGCCINKNKSGLREAEDDKAYQQQWYQEHKEEKADYQRQYRLKKKIELFCPTKAKETPQLLMSYGVVIKGRYELSNIYSNFSVNSIS